MGLRNVVNASAGRSKHTHTCVFSLGSPRLLSGVYRLRLIARLHLHHGISRTNRVPYPNCHIAYIHRPIDEPRRLAEDYSLCEHFVDFDQDNSWLVLWGVRCQLAYQTTRVRYHIDVMNFYFSFWSLPCFEMHLKCSWSRGNRQRGFKALILFWQLTSLYSCYFYFPNRTWFNFLNVRNSVLINRILPHRQNTCYMLNIGNGTNHYVACNIWRISEWYRHTVRALYKFSIGKKHKFKKLFLFVINKSDLDPNFIEICSL